jgi:hypothetical protein
MVCSGAMQDAMVRRQSEMSRTPRSPAPPPPSPCTVNNRASEAFLQQVVSLLVASHYKNTPNDLLLLADAPAHQLYVLLAPVDETQVRALRHAATWVTRGTEDQRRGAITTWGGSLRLRPRQARVLHLKYLFNILRVCKHQCSKMLLFP